MTKIEALDIIGIINRVARCLYSGEHKQTSDPAILEARARLLFAQDRLCDLSGLGYNDPFVRGAVDERECSRERSMVRNIVEPSSLAGRIYAK